jgi:Ser-tRNA(Ala) deacylase AlaX
MMINDQSKVHIQSEEGLKKQVDYLTEKMKEYRTKSNNMDALLIENDNLKLKVQALTAAEASFKSVGSEIDFLRQENKTLKVKNGALIAENGTHFMTRFDQQTEKRPHGRSVNDGSTTRSGIRQAN